MSCSHTRLLSALQVGLAQMLKGSVIMDVTNVEEARIAEEAGAVAVMALERVPADIRRDGGVARMRCTLFISENLGHTLNTGRGLLTDICCSSSRQMSESAIHCDPVIQRSVLKMYAFALLAATQA